MRFISSRRGVAPLGFRWDEEVIAEHDKVRGTRQRILEPKTPFEQSPETSDCEEDSLEQLENVPQRIRKVGASSNQTTFSTSSCTSKRDAMSAVASKLELLLLKQAAHSRHRIDASDEESEASIEEANAGHPWDCFRAPEVEE